MNEDEKDNGENVPYNYCYECACLTVVRHMDVPVSSCDVITQAEEGLREIDEGDLRSAETTWEKGEGRCHCWTMMTYAGPIIEG